MKAFAAVCLKMHLVPLSADRTVRYAAQDRWQDEELPVTEEETPDCATTAARTDAANGGTATAARDDDGVGGSDDELDGPSSLSQVLGWAAVVPKQNARPSLALDPFYI